LQKLSGIIEFFDEWPMRRANRTRELLICPLDWRARRLALDLVSDMLENVFTMFETSDGSALLPLATEFLPWTHIRICSEGMRECGVTTDNTSNALGIADQGHWHLLLNELWLLKNTHHIPAIWRGEAFANRESS
jgi:hypothetical protein